MFIISSFIALSVLAASHPTMTRFVGFVLTRQNFSLSSPFFFDSPSVNRSRRSCMHWGGKHSCRRKALLETRIDPRWSTNDFNTGKPISRFVVHLDDHYRNFKTWFGMFLSDLMEIIPFWKMECKSGNVKWNGFSRRLNVVSLRYFRCNGLSDL